MHTAMFQQKKPQSLELGAQVLGSPSVDIHD